MYKTGESYTSARAQLLRKAFQAPMDEPAAASIEDRGVAGAPIAIDPAAAVTEEIGTVEPATPPAEALDPALLPTSDEAMRRATGRGYAEWFSVLDAWGARERTHAQMSTWLVAEQGAPGWWSQAITVGYERARGLRAVHQVVGGYSIGANRTIGVGAEPLLAAVVDAGLRAGWLAEAPTLRHNSQGLGMRFSWAEPPSRVALFVAAKGPDKATISVQHEKLPDAAAGERMKKFWREELSRLKTAFEDAT
jgi:hypothetical protein